MNGAHDLGGMHGFGAVNAEAETAEPVFHADWEKRVFAMVLATGALGRWNIDMARFARESQPPDIYLRNSYYENWFAGLVTLLIDKGLVTRAELASGQAQAVANDALQANVLKAGNVAATLAQGTPTVVPATTAPRFRSGDRVRAVNRHPTGHTREPRYVRGKLGLIHEHYGEHVFPDMNALGTRMGQHLYCVRFEAAELWGESANEGSSVFVDLWESYLE